MATSTFHMNVYSNIIIQLIVDDLKITKLLNGFSQMGLDTAPYEFNLYNLILLHAGIKSKDQTEELKDWYYKKSESVFSIELSDEMKLNEIAREILLGLTTRK